MDNNVKKILNEVWDQLPQAYFNRHPKDAVKDFLKIYNQIKEERKNK